MFICENCKDRLNVMDTPEGDRAFPAFAVLGGLVGTIAGAATGTILLVPAAVALGAVADMQRCGVCGEQAPGSSPGYRLMEELGGETGSRSYRPVGSPQGGKQPQGTGPAALRLAPAAPSPTRHFEEARPPGLSRQDDQAEDRPVYVFDEIEGGLVRQETNSEGAPADFDAPFAPEEGFGAFLSSAPALFDSVYGEDPGDLAEPGFEAIEDIGFIEGPTIEGPMP